MATIATIQTHSTQGTPSSLLTHGGSGLSSVIQHDKPSGGGVFGNIYEFSFEDGTGGKLTNFSGGPITDSTVWSPPTTLAITTADSVLNGSHCLEIDYGVDSSTDQGCPILFQTTSVGPAFNEFYTRFALKLSHANNTAQKLLRYRDSGIGLVGGSLIANLNGGLDFSWIWDAGGGPNVQPIPNTPLINNVLNQWHWWEIHFKSIAGQTEVVDIWFDDVKVLSATATTATNTTVTGFSIDGTCNAGTNTAFFARFDQLGVSTTKMGIPAQSSNP